MRQLYKIKKRITGLLACVQMLFSDRIDVPPVVAEIMPLKRRSPKKTIEWLLNIIYEIMHKATHPNQNSKTTQISGIFLFCALSSSFAQIGINTTSPTRDLDVNGDLRIRNLPSQNVNESNFLTTDANGNIGQSTAYILSDVDAVIASTNVDRTVTGLGIRDNVPLGLSIRTTIPANKEGLVIIQYSVPVGISSFTEPRGYYGIRFLRNGVEAVEGSRKFSMMKEGHANMVSVSNVYVEHFSPRPNDRTITFNCKGYIEQRSGSGANRSHTYRFNMWSTGTPNFNWGRATISKQVFIR
ncbi:hypothetical protein [Dokdonia sinensis]|nr:hypothetical protein [Dokdonia sinensis]